MTRAEERSSASDNCAGLDMRTAACLPPERCLSPEESEKHLLALQTVCLTAAEVEDLEGLCQIPALPQKGVAMAGVVVLQAVEQQGQGVPAGSELSVREGICVFYDLGLMQINVLQEKGQAESSESKPTEKPPDMLLMEVQVQDVVKMVVH